MVGSAIVRELESQGYSNILTPSRSEVDLEKLNDVDYFFEESKPDDLAQPLGGLNSCGALSEKPEHGFWSLST